MPRRKVCFVLPSLNGGGAERAAVQILNGLDDTRWDRSMFLFAREGPYLSEVDSRIAIHSADTSSRWGRWRKLRSLIATERPEIVMALAHDYGWTRIAGGKLGLEDKKTEREINRAVSYAQGTRMSDILNKAFDMFEENEAILRSAIITTTEDGRQVVTAKPLVELAKALETAHSIKYRALGDKVAENADPVGENSDRIKSLSLTVVNLMNNAAANAKIPTKVVTDSVVNV